MTGLPADRDSLDVDPADVARRARTENFPIASVLFPRAVRRHLHAIYGFCRLVDMLGDEATGDRPALLDELERELDACYAAPGAPGPTWPVMQQLAPTIRACTLEREPFRRLIDCNRQDQHVADYASWAEVKQYCTLSADPVGRMVLGVVGLAGEQRLLGASDDVCTGLQLVNFLQDVPRDLELGRIYLPADDRARFGARCSSSRLTGHGSCSRVGRCCGARSAAGSAGRSASSLGAAWRRSTRWTRPAGTSSRSGRGRRRPASPAPP